MSQVEVLRKSYHNNSLYDVKDRIKVLQDFLRFYEEEEDAILECMKKDLGKSKQEAYSTEVGPVKYEINHIISNLSTWAAEKHLPRTFMFATDHSSIQYQPFGVVLTIGSWNYPFQVPISTCIGAISGGNTVLIKPSELAPESAEFLKKNLSKYVDKKYVDILCGGPKETTELLVKERFDFIIYTGGKTVGKIIMKAAAENLTPVCLELGGKCPVYIDKSANLPLAASRLVWAKFLNCGQTCIGPDYVLCEESILNELSQLMKEKVTEYFTENPEKSKDYGRIINKNHTKRLAGLINDTSGKLRVGGNVDLENNFVQPTIVSNVTMEDSLMKDEIFGPILPIITVKDCEDAIAKVRNGEKPLSIYVYSTNKKIFDIWKRKTTSGSIVHNDCVIQAANPLLPFGGVGHSGFGAYKGKYSFELFSHKRSVLDKSTIQTFDALRLPPYTEKSFAWAKWGMKSSNCCIM